MFGSLQAMKVKVTAIVTLVVVAIQFSESWITRSQFEFARVVEGEIWRIWTGHLTHFGWNHLFWDLLMFVVLGIVCERKFKERYLPGLILMMGLITGAVVCLRQDIVIYRGLSGIDTGLFAWIATDSIRQAWKERDRIGVLLWGVPVAGLLAKLGFEWNTGTVLFVDADHFVPLVEAHLAGMIGGMALGIRDVFFLSPKLLASVGEANAIRRDAVA